MEVNATGRLAAEETAAPKPAVVDYRADVRHLLAGSDPTATCQGSWWNAGRVEQPSLTVMFTGGWTAPIGWRRDEPSAQLMAQCHGSAGIVSLRSDYGPLLPHIGSSPLIVDRRCGLHPHWTGAAPCRWIADACRSRPVERATSSTLTQQVSTRPCHAGNSAHHIRVV